MSTLQKILRRIALEKGIGRNKLRMNIETRGINLGMAFRLLKNVKMYAFEARISGVKLGVLEELLKRAHSYLNKHTQEGEIQDKKR